MNPMGRVFPASPGSYTVPDFGIPPAAFTQDGFVVVLLHQTVYSILRLSSPGSVRAWEFDSVPYSGDWHRITAATMGAAIGDRVGPPSFCYLVFDASSGKPLCNAVNCGNCVGPGSGPTYSCSCARESRDMSFEEAPRFDVFEGAAMHDGFAVVALHPLAYVAVRAANPELVTPWGFDRVPLHRKWHRITSATVGPRVTGPSVDPGFCYLVWDHGAGTARCAAVNCPQCAGPGEFPNYSCGCVAKQAA